LGDNHYAAGFCVGLKHGVNQSLVNYVPNTLSCCRGILHGIWGFAKDPKGSGMQVVDASYYFVETLRENTLKENLELMVPELKELYQKWEVLSSYDIGERVGFIVGKYGLDIFTPLITLKTIHIYQNFRRANSLTTLRSCATSKKECAEVQVMQKPDKGFGMLPKQEKSYLKMETKFM
jgi:hypothetical protein